MPVFGRQRQAETGKKDSAYRVAGKYKVVIRILSHEPNPHPPPPGRSIDISVAVVGPAQVKSVSSALGLVKIVLLRDDLNQFQNGAVSAVNPNREILFNRA